MPTPDHEPSRKMVAAFQRALVPFQQSAQIDPQHIYVAGHSGGGNLAMELTIVRIWKQRLLLLAATRSG